VKAKTSISHAFAAAWSAPDRRPIHEWAMENVILPHGAGYALTGRLNFTGSEYLIEPLRANGDDSIRSSTIQKGVQTGGSVTGDITVAHLICTRPQNLYWNFPTEKQADAYAQRRAMKFLRACPIVAERIAKAQLINRHDIGKTELRLGNMWLAIQAANETNLQSHSVPVVINEELWEWRPSMYQHAVARTTYYDWRAKIINISQAGDKGSDMDQAFQAGTMEIWEVPCLHCDQFHSLPFNLRLGQHNGQFTYAGLAWDTNETTRPNGVWNFDALKPMIRFICPHCRKETPDDKLLRRKMNALGRYRVTNPGAPRDRRSFHWPSWACVEVSWYLIVEEYLRAKDQEKIGNRVPIREWYQKRAALSYDPEAHRTFDLAPAIILTSDPAQPADKPKKFWDQQDFIFGAFDVQRDHFWGLVEAWSKTGESMVLWAGRLQTWQDIEDKQKEFNIQHRCMFLDARHRPHDVYRNCTLHGRVQRVGNHMQWICWTAVMGDARRHYVYTIRRGRQKGRRIDLPYSWPSQWADPCLGMRSDDPDLPILRGKQCPLIYFAKGTIDPMSFERRELLLRGQVAHMAKGEWNEEFSKQLQGEQPETIISPLGHTVHKVRCVGPNHLLDCWRISLVGAAMAEILGARPIE